jgi:hypothetical protein
VDFVNQSSVEAGWTWGLERDGRELIIVVIKATYDLPEKGAEASLSSEQAKLTEPDEFTGEPGLSAPLYETDYSHRKLSCDVLLNGSAHVPFPATSTRVRLSVGQVDKQFHVFGTRRWDGVFLSIVPTDPEIFTQQPISYDCAYGGTDSNPDEPGKVATYSDNPVGTGYHPIRRRSALPGLALPNTSEQRSPIEDTNGSFRPMSFGPIGRNFHPRYKHAGTYDQYWMDNIAPLWPDDFSYAYFQCAPADQQTPFLQGGEEVILENLTRGGGIRIFHIPRKQMPVTFLPHRGADIVENPVCDTLLIEPDLNRFSLTWRVSLPLRRNIFDIKRTIVGDLPRSFYTRRRAELLGKAYYPNLAALIEARRK